MRKVLLIIAIAASASVFVIDIPEHPQSEPELLTTTEPQLINAEEYSQGWIPPQMQDNK